MGQTDRRTARAGVPIALAIVGFVVLALVAGGGSVHVWHDPPPAGDRRVGAAQADPSEPASATQGTLPPEQDGLHDNGWVTGSAVVLVLLLVVYVVYVIMTTWPKLRSRRSRGVDITERRLQPLPHLDPATVELDEAAELVALQGGTPRNAIVACWLQMEEDVARSGMPKDPSETSSEYTSRVLGASSLDPVPVRTLAALYREARFSRHELGAAHRDDAFVALRQIHASLAARRAQAAAQATAGAAAGTTAGSASSADPR